MLQHRQGGAAAVVSESPAGLAATSERQIQPVPQPDFKEAIRQAPSSVRFFDDSLREQRFQFALHRAR